MFDGSFGMCSRRAPALGIGDFRLLSREFG
jgi:hypothetical protein